MTGASPSVICLTFVGLVGDGSVYDADSALWTAAHHRNRLPRNRPCTIAVAAGEDRFGHRP